MAARRPPNDNLKFGPPAPNCEAGVKDRSNSNEPGSRNTR